MFSFIHSSNKQKGILLVLLMLSLLSTPEPASAQKATFLNPILSGFYPDPSICRVGDDYYLVNSTFSYFPGVPVFHSKDLVSWKQIGHVLDRPEQLDLSGLGVSEGIYAPTIQFHQGIFYMVTTLVGRGGNFVVTAKNPAGPWSNPVWLPQVTGIDPSLFFDEDGKSYVVFNSGPPEEKSIYEGHCAIWMYEFDKQNLKTIGEIKLLINGGTDISRKPIWIEGPHLLKKEGLYYLMCAEGGTGYDHSEVIFRSKSMNEPFVPYEKNPILTQRTLDRERPYPITTTGHADLVETPSGEWWAVFLGCRPYAPTSEDLYNVGRETFLAPVKWKNGWPIINPDYQEVQYRYPAPQLPVKKVTNGIANGNFTLKDDFTTSKLEYDWLFLRTPKTTWHSVSAGSLTLQVRPETVVGKENPSFVARRQQHSTFEASAAMRFVAANESELAGLVAFQNEEHHYILGKTKEKGKTVIQLIKSAKPEDAATPEVLAQIELKPEQDKKPVSLKIAQHSDGYAFSYAFEPGKWMLLKDKVDAPFLSTKVAGGFVGTTLGMYATSNGKPSTNKAVFDWFSYTGNDLVYEDKEFLDKQK